MKSLIISSYVIAVVVCFVCARPGEEKYTNRYNDVDLDEILKSDRLLRNYLNCLLDKGKCATDGAELKKNLPDALENNCEKCDEDQRAGARKVIHFLIDNKRDWWNELAAKYDSEGQYLKKYEEEAKKENLNL